MYSISGCSPFNGRTPIVLLSVGGRTNVRTYNIGTVES